MEESNHTNIIKEDIDIYINSLFSNVLIKCNNINKRVKNINKDSIFNLNEYNIDEYKSDSEIDWKEQGMNQEIQEYIIDKKNEEEEENKIINDDIALYNNELYSHDVDVNENYDLY